MHWAPLPNRCLPTSFTSPALYLFTYRYVHARFPPSPSLASTAPLVSTSTTPALFWLSEYPLSACRAGKTLLLDASKLSSMAVLCLLSFGWGKNTSHRKWYYIPPLPTPSPPFSRGERVGVRGIAHSCAVPLRHPPRDLIPKFSVKGF